MTAEADASRGPDARFDLTGKTALVTGGSRGLGRAMVLGFAAAGADVAIVGRTEATCRALADEIAERTGRRAEPIVADVSRWDQLDGLVERAYEAFGRIDVLVNNAGKSPFYESVDAIDEEHWDKVIAVNLKGPFRLSALVGTRMAADVGGSIINVSSVAATNPRPNVVPYAAAKAGINAITVAFAHTWGPSVRVNAILPGAFLTDVSKAWDMDAFAEESSRYALRRAGRPDEIVGAALYLASEASSFTTGSVLTVDGGYVAP